VRRFILVAVTCVTALGARAASADTRHACTALDADAIAVDGMLDDWAGIDAATIGGGDRDASLDVRCGVEGGSLALAFDVRDEHVIRSAVAVGPGDDLLTVKLDGAVVTIAPGLGSIAPQVKLDGKPAPKWLAFESTLQRAGWSVEVVVPLAKLRGWKAGTAEVTADVSYRDGDVMRGTTPERTIGDALVLQLPGAEGGAAETVHAPSGKDVMKSFLATTGLGKADVTLDASADVDPSTRGPEHVVAGKRVIGLVGDRFTYIELPAASDADVIARPKLYDLRGDGTRVILTVVRQDGGAGTRDVLLGFAARGGQLAQLFAIEVRREMEGKKLESSWSVTTGKHPQIVVKAKPAVGWDADSYNEQAARDAEPIALPWDDDRWGAAYTLEGDALKAHPLPGHRPSK
jgi:hypothetical protein